MDTVIYIRWSSAEQGKGSSLERQREDCRTHAAAKGWNVVAELVDEGVSAFKGRHAAVGQLGRFVADVEAGAYINGVILLTEKLDRLSREHAKTMFVWMHGLTELGVTVATVEGDRRYHRDNLDMAAIIEVVVKAQLANEESEKKASRLSAAWAAKRGRLARGEHVVLTSRAPGWLAVERNPARFVVIEERAEVVRRIFRDTVAGLGKHHIARNLNLEGVQPFGRAQGWHGSYIQKILTGSAVLGEFQPGRKPRGERRRTAGDAVGNYYPRIVDPDLYAAAARAMGGRQRRVAGKGRRLTNLFAGLTTCGSCGSRMTLRAKGRARRADGTEVHEDYLVCDSYQRGRGCRSGHHFNYAQWSGGVLTAILHAAMNDRHFSSPDAVRPIEIDIAERTRARAAAAARAEIALTLHVETGRSEPKERWLDATREMDELDEVIRNLQVRLVEARGAVSPEEHLQRIQALQDKLDDKDEEVRFVARSRVMEAVHELVATMIFQTDPPRVTLGTKDGVCVHVGWEDWGEGPLLVSTATTTNPSGRWPDRYDPPDYVQPD
ncbi:DNA invertase Pin-like site-specific DNA recombinase [Sphingomonas jinjuensis]|uniref:DNA invertase Pin-like site-specific DNA recombinase n=1 Tax=Sphingomonas jinjuensis TaxID=535907 RepID=A0A840FE32_9SPHN|nr:recombinase family protein [Sphingomonas jinjuensis]MBB4155071.1 DNA invertase Pin-like site-specific DNA recombinase [Sphingomonas jinjuensis]